MTDTPVSQSPDLREIGRPEISADGVQRFWAKVDASDADGCWTWQGGLNRGYGNWQYAGRKAPAHRWSVWISGRDIPPKMVIDHLCRNPSCVHPDHLEVVTNQENLIRGKMLVTHCRQGHEYAGSSLGWRLGRYGRDYRVCRKCEAIARRHKYLLRKSLRKAS